MSRGVTSYGAMAWLEMIFGARSVPAGYWIALLARDADPSVDGELLRDEIEVPRLGGYGRVLTDSWTGGAGGFLNNAEVVRYGTPTDDWGVVAGWALCSAQDTGEVYAYGDFIEPRYVGGGNTFNVAQGALTVTMTGPTTRIVA